MRIIALVPGDIGNQLLFFPTLETLRQQYPQAVIDVLVEPRAKAAYQVCKNVDNVLVFDYRDRSSLADYLNLLGIIRDREYDVSLSLGTGWFVESVVWLNGIPRRIGYQGNSDFYLSHPVVAQSDLYVPQKYHNLLQGLQINAPCPPVTINVAKEDIDWAEQEQQRLNLKDSGYILLYGEDVAISEAQDTYPVDKWQQIIENIQQKQTGLTTVLLQTSENREWNTAMMSASNKLIAIAPPDIGKLAAIIAGANLILCTNSTPMQLAIATDTYTVALLKDKAALKYLPDSSESCVSIASPSGKIADIEPELVLKQMWQS
ncbi:glycosyltransferase family 9 protein [Myxosarcina sp. GI1]|uniref:glycosyltransferase family 9 protein n=1 Tax=Myxosarcina sp. GI1 TaxID=1541065 RepID=UPI000561ACC3|nr:glycosyltransferase family 9 protein [Myxosarcina sp. GI1]